MCCVSNKEAVCRGGTNIQRFPVATLGRRLINTLKQTVLVKFFFYYMLNRECRARWRLTASSLATFWREEVRGGGAAEDKTALLSCRACGDLQYSSTRETIRCVAYP